MSHACASICNGMFDKLCTSLQRRFDHEGAAGATSERKGCREKAVNVNAAQICPDLPSMLNDMKKQVTSGKINKDEHAFFNGKGSVVYSYRPLQQNAIARFFFAAHESKLFDSNACSECFRIHCSPEYAGTCETCYRLRLEAETRQVSVEF